VLIDLDVNGKKELVLVKDVQKDYVRRSSSTSTSSSSRRRDRHGQHPRRSFGHPFPGTVAMLEHQTIQVDAEATQIPEHLEVDVTGMLEHTHILRRMSLFPPRVKLHLDPEAIIVAIQAVRAPSRSVPTLRPLLQSAAPAAEGAAE